MASEWALAKARAATIGCHREDHPHLAHPTGGALCVCLRCVAAALDGIDEQRKAAVDRETDLGERLVATQHKLAAVTAERDAALAQIRGLNEDLLGRTVEEGKMALRIAELERK